MIGLNWGYGWWDLMVEKATESVTIKSIARDLGLSFSTVAKALNNNPSVKEETRRLVLARADEMGYSPNMLARGLRSKSTKTIGVVFNDIENPVLAYIFKNISIDMAKHGYSTLICDSQFDEEIERSNILSVLSRMPDAVIFFPATVSPKNFDLFSGMMNQVIVLDAYSPNSDCHFVDVDYNYGGYLSACELLSKGHRDILVITEPLEFPISNQYVAGIRKAFQEYNVPFNENLVKFAHASISNGYSTVMSLWDNQKRAFTETFTAVMNFDDNLAHGVYKAVAQFGLSVPDDISVIGFDDNPLSIFSNPPLTTVYLPKEKIANSCIEILHNIILEGKTNKTIYSLSPHLVCRGSVKEVF
jgi:LacI family transcriptional regulator